MDSLLRHCVGGKLLDKHGTVDQLRVTCPRDTTSVFRRERSQPYLIRASSRVDPYTTELTLVPERTSQSPSRPTQAAPPCKLRQLRLPEPALRGYGMAAASSRRLVGMWDGINYVVIFSILQDRGQDRGNIT